MYHQPTKPEKYDNTSPKDPLILLGSSFYHADGVPTYTQGVSYTIQLFLRSLQHLSLFSQITKYCSSSLEILIELCVGLGHERLFMQCSRLSVIVGGGGTE